MRGHKEHALWSVQIALAAVFTVVAVAKLTGNPSSVEVFDRIGWGDWFRYVTGVVELIGALGMLIPRLAGLAALGLATVMVGATVANVLVLTPSVLVLTIPLGVAAAAVAAVRRAEVRKLVRRWRLSNRRHRRGRLNPR